MVKDQITKAGSDQGAPYAMDLKGAAAHAGLSYWTLRDLVLSGYIPRVTLPRLDGLPARRILVLRKDVESFLENRRESFNAQPEKGSGVTVSRKRRERTGLRRSNRMPKPPYASGRDSVVGTESPAPPSRMESQGNASCAAR